MRQLLFRYLEKTDPDNNIKSPEKESPNNKCVENHVMCGSSKDYGLLSTSKSASVLNLRIKTPKGYALIVADDMDDSYHDVSNYHHLWDLTMYKGDCHYNIERLIPRLTVGSSKDHYGPSHKEVVLSKGGVLAYKIVNKQVFEYFEKLELEVIWQVGKKGLFHRDIVKEFIDATSIEGISRDPEYVPKIISYMEIDFVYNLYEDADSLLSNIGCLWKSQRMKGLLDNQIKFLHSTEPIQHLKSEKLRLVEHILSTAK